MRFRFLVILILINSLLAPSFAFAYGGNGGPGDSSESTEVITEIAGVSFIAKGKSEPGSKSNGTQGKPLSPSEFEHFKNVYKGKSGLFTFEAIDSAAIVWVPVASFVTGISFPTTFLVGFTYQSTKYIVRILSVGLEKTVDINERSIGGHLANIFIFNFIDSRKRNIWKEEFEKNTIRYKY